MHYRTAFLVLAALVLTTPSAHLAADEPLLVYERTHARITGTDDNTIRLIVRSSGQAEIHFPSYMNTGGNYTRQLENEELEHVLELAAGIAETTQEDLEAELNPPTPSSRETASSVSSVTDADSVRFEYRDAERGRVELSAPSPDIWSQMLSDADDLANLAVIERDLRAWMKASMEERVQ